MGAGLLLLSPAVPAQETGGDPLVFVEKGVALNAKGDYQGAIDSFNHALEINPQDPAAFEGRGETHLAQGDLTDAVDDFTKALQVEPGDEPALFHRAAAESKNGNFAAALADDNSALQTTALPSSEAAAIHLQRGQTRFCQGDNDGALADAAFVLQVHPASPDALFLRGVAENAKGDATAAANDFAQAATAGLPEAALWFWLAKQETQAGDAAETQLPALLQKSFRGKPDPWISELADLLMQKTTATQVISDLPTAATNPVKAEQGWFFLGLAREFSTDTAGARQAYGRVITLAAPDSYRAVEAHRRLKLLPS